MSIESINSFAPVLPVIVEETVEEINALFIAAAEKLDVDQMIELLDQGADPKKEISYTEELMKNYFILTISKNFYRETTLEKLKDQLEGGFYPDFIAKEVKLILNDIDHNVHVSDETLKALFIKTVMQEYEGCVTKDPRLISPLLISVLINSPTLATKLIESGVELTPEAFHGENCREGLDFLDENFFTSIFSELLVENFELIEVFRKQGLSLEGIISGGSATIIGRLVYTAEPKEYISFLEKNRFNFTEALSSKNEDGETVFPYLIEEAFQELSCGANLDVILYLIDQYQGDLDLQLKLLNLDSDEFSSKENKLMNKLISKAITFQLITN